MTALEALEILRDQYREGGGLVSTIKTSLLRTPTYSGPPSKNHSAHLDAIEVAKDLRQIDGGEVDDLIRIIEQALKEKQQLEELIQPEIRRLSDRVAVLERQSGSTH